MLLLARLAALSVATAVLMLFVVPRIVGTPEPGDGGKATSGDVKIAENTRWGERSAETPSSGKPGSQETTSWGERAPVPESETWREDEKAPVPGASSLADASDEVKRYASIEKGHAIEIKPPGRKRFYRVIVKDAGTLKTGNHLISLKGISVREEDEACKDESGKSWPCGARARTALMRLIRGRAVVCDLPPGGDQPEFSASCRIGKTDLSLWMVEQGWAEPASETNGGLAKAHDKAKRAKLGLWGGPPQYRPEPIFNEPVPVFEQEPIDDEADQMDPIYDQ